MRKNIMRTVLFVCILFQAAFGFAQPTNFTYNYDFWGEQVASPDAYFVSAFILGSDLGIGDFRDPQGLFIRGNRIYVADSGNNRVVVLEAREGGEHVVINVVHYVMIDGERSYFNYPMDVFESRAGFIYIADTNNRRALRLDSDWNYVFSITRPYDESFEAHWEFRPGKLVVDFSNRIFIQALGINRGLMEFDNRGNFVGYMGANRVQVTIVDRIWRMLSTQEQRARQLLFIPTEYNNVTLDRSGFIFVTSSTGDVDPVRRLNAMGDDILIRNGHTDPVGDLAWGNAGGISGPSRFIDVATFPNDSFACFDRTRGRIFVYDFQGNLLYAFGGVGSRQGHFLQPVALDSMGFSLFALDSRTAAITRFDLTLYGQLINNALSEYRAGRYEASAMIWQEVLRMNGNFELGYVGIARAALRQGDYRTAMRYFRLMHHREGFSRAFQRYRMQWVEDNLWLMLLGLAVVVGVPKIVKFTMKTVREIKEA